ncbi:hypothetical protein [Natronoflexus pectinivorans]|uniref:Tetratricopeptide repeat protein n=1 Tax=Natronoflexus pectinivorans TaxID=682526 RepID=A0A4R2GKS9_9BACT|nr:hypothetical protein [Natronoflexus pectinivorans]TCO07999.1 hypothetical protein EV194_106141 [Natronoflexus pectinivorans]
MQNPSVLNEQSLEQLREVLEEYPFFQAGRLLWVKNLHNLDHIRYNNELKLAAAHIPDRSRLYSLINHISQPINLAEPEKESQELVSTEVLQDVEPESVLASPDKEEDQAAAIGEDYFSVDDVYETSSGSQVDFSDKRLNNKKEEFKSDPENIILPSADFLGYETDVASEYQLPGDNEQVSLDESRSFSEWLNVLRHQPVAKSEQHQEEVEPEEKKDKKMALIDSFLQQGDRRRIKVSEGEQRKENPKDFSLKSLQESNDLMTETLANIYIHQKHFLKAIDIFKQLSLKYPEKNIYFARRIKELEEEINNQ